MKLKLYFKWYDFWIGLYYDKMKKRLYIGFLPMLGLMIQFNADKPVDSWENRCMAMGIIQDELMRQNDEYRSRLTDTRNSPA